MVFCHSNLHIKQKNTHLILFLKKQSTGHIQLIHETNETCGQRVLEDLYVDDQAFSLPYDLNPPTLPSTRGMEWGKSQIIRHRDSLVLYKLLNTFCLGLSQTVLDRTEWWKNHRTILGLYVSIWLCVYVSMAERLPFNQIILIPNSFSSARFALLAHWINV